MTGAWHAPVNMIREKVFEGIGGRSRNSLTSPRRLRAKYTHRTNLRFVLCVFRPCRELPPTGGYVRRQATYVAYSLSH